MSNKYIDMPRLSLEIEAGFLEVKVEKLERKIKKLTEQSKLLQSSSQFNTCFKTDTKVLFPIYRYGQITEVYDSSCKIIDDDGHYFTIDNKHIHIRTEGV